RLCEHLLSRLRPPARRRHLRQHGSPRLRSRNGSSPVMILHRAIAIDGPAASGKSTLARILSRRLGLIMVNSGAMYRAVTWKILQLGIDPTDRQAVVGALREMDLRCGIDGLDSTVRIDGIDPGDELRGEAVNAAVSAVSAVPEVRECLVSLQRDYLKLGDVVMEGRDIGTVVFPETP